MAVSRTTCKECGRIVLRLSWSALRVHEECKQAGHLQRQGKALKMANQRVFFPGTVTDRVVRDWLENDPEHNPGIMPDMVSSVIDRERGIISDQGGAMLWKDSADRAQVEADCIEAVTKIEPALNRLVVPYEYQADYRFRIPVDLPHPGGGTEQVLLVGAMDIIVRDDKGRWYVWDVKHTKDNSYWRKTQGQLTFYDLAVMLENGSPTERSGLLQPLCSEQVKPFTITEDLRSQMMQRISGMARDIWTSETPPRQDTTYCGWCSVKHACSKFTPVQRPDGKRVMEF